MPQPADVYVAHLSLDRLPVVRRVELPLEPASRRSSVPTVRARPTSSRRSATSRRWPATGSPPMPRWCGPAPNGRSCGRSVVRDDRHRRCSRSRSTPAGPTARASTARPVPRAREVLGVLRTVLFAPGGPRAGQGRPGRAAPVPRRTARRAHPRMAGVRADYDRVLKQRNALLKTRRHARGARGPATTCAPWTSGTRTSPRAGRELLAARLAAGRRCCAPLRRARRTRRRRRRSGGGRRARRTAAQLGRGRRAGRRPRRASTTALLEALARGRPQGARARHLAWSARTATSWR